MLTIRPVIENKKAKSFCHDFVYSNMPKYVFGRNEWAESIAKSVDVVGFIDDFTSEKEYLGKPIVPIEEVPENALVVSAVIGKPLIAEKRLSRFRFRSLDYFSFYKYAGLSLKQVMFWEGMVEDIRKNREKYEWVYDLLQDNVSKNQFYNILNFRNAYDLDYMRGFEDKERFQYFEPFLDLKKHGESFVDIGGFDGYTTEEFIRRCPGYKQVLFFEPEEHNMQIAKRRLADYDNIHYFPLGLSDRKQTLRFSNLGSSSKICDEGEREIRVERLDELVDSEMTFLKMDIEGAEKEAIEGARRLIENYHPRLAISVYHQKDDFWKIPETVLGIRSDYRLYLRHYTEGISETIMFFMPYKNREKA